MHFPYEDDTKTSASWWYQMHLPPYPQPKGPEEKGLALLNEVILENHRGLCITLYKTNDKDILPGFILNLETWKTWKIGHCYKKSGKTWNSQGTFYNFIQVRDKSGKTKYLVFNYWHSCQSPCSICCQLM